MPIIPDTPPAPAPAPAPGDWLTGSPFVGGDVPAAMLGKSPAQLMAPPPAPKDETPVTVVGPDGKAYNLPQWQLPDAQAQGFRLESHNEALGRKYQQEHPYKSAFNAFGRAVLEGATLGVVDGKMWRDFGQSIGASPGQIAKLEESAKREKTATTIGQIGGIAASMLTGAPLVEAGGAAASAIGLQATETTGLVAKTLISAGRGAIEVAALEAPKAVRDVIRDEPEKAWESMAAGIGGGLLLGAAGPLLMKGAEYGLEKAAKFAPKLEKFKQRTAFEAIGDNQASLKIGEKDARFLGERGNPASGGEEIGRYLTAEGKAYARSPLQSLEQYEQQTLDPAIAEWQGKQKAAIKAAGLKTDFNPQELVEHTWGGLREELGASPSTTALADGVQSQIDNFKRVWMEPVLRPNGEQIVDSAGEVMMRWKPVTFEQAYDELGKFSSTIADYKSDPAKRGLVHAMRQMRGEFQENLLVQARKAGAEMDAAAIKEANHHLSRLYSVEKTVDDNLYRNLSNRALSPSDMGAGFTTAGVLGLAHGGPLGMAGGYAAAMTHRLIRTRGNAALARIIPDGESLKALETSLTMMGERFAQLPEVLGGTLKVAPAQSTARILGDFAAAKFDVFGDEEPTKPAKTPVQAYGQISQRITDLTSNPDRMATAMGKLASHFSDNPDVATGLVAHNTAALLHLQQVMPKAPMVPNPLIKQQWQPSRQELDDFAKRLAVVHDPYVVLGKISQGNLSPVEWQTQAAVWPAHTKNLMQGMMEYAVSGKAKPIAHERLTQFQIATGAALTPAFKDLASYQAVYINEQKAQQGAGGGGGKKLKGPEAQTNAQSLEQR